MWDRHVNADSKEHFIEMYSKWYGEFIVSKREVLNFMGIDHRMRPDGSVVVFENDLINQTPIKEKEFKIND